jgi:hypothetical protein
MASLHDAGLGQDAVSALVAAVDDGLRSEVAALELAYSHWRSAQASLAAAQDDVRARKELLARLEADTAALLANAQATKAAAAAAAIPLSSSDDSAAQPVLLDVGGTLFRVAPATLASHAGSALAAVAAALTGSHDAQSGLTAEQSRCLRAPSTAVYIDRDPALFRLALAFMETGALPAEPDALRRLYVESAHYRLVRLRDAIELKLLDARLLDQAPPAGAPAAPPPEATLARAPAARSPGEPRGQFGAPRASSHAASLMALIDLDVPWTSGDLRTSGRSRLAASTAVSAGAAAPATAVAASAAHRGHSPQVRAGVYLPRDDPSPRSAAADSRTPTAWPGVEAPADVRRLFASMLEEARPQTEPAGAGSDVDMAEYMSGRWRERYAQAVPATAEAQDYASRGWDAAGTGDGFAQPAAPLRSAPSPLRTSMASNISQRAAATTLADPFGFSRWRASAGSQLLPYDADVAGTPRSLFARGSVSGLGIAPGRGLPVLVHPQLGKEPAALAAASPGFEVTTGAGGEASAAAAPATYLADTPTAEALASASPPDADSAGRGSSATEAAGSSGLPPTPAADDDDLEDVTVRLSAIRRNVALTLAKLRA